MNRAAKGFTLIELMIVVAIVAILVAIAYPSYTRYVRRANRADATKTLLQLASAQEKYFLQNNTYTTTLSDLSITQTDRNLYALSIPTADKSTFSVTATPQGSQAGDTDCAQFKVTQTGARTAINSGGTDNSPNCWK